MDNVTDFPNSKLDLIAEMKGAESFGNDLVIHGRVVPNVKMYDRRPARNEIEFCVGGRVMYGFPPDQAWNAAAFAFATMAMGAGCDPLNFEPRPFAMKRVNLGGD